MNTAALHQINWVWSITKGHRPALLIYFLLELFAIALSLLFVLWSKRAVDMAMQPSAADMKMVLILVVTSLLFALAIRGFSSWLNERTSLKMGLDLQQKMIEVQMMSVWKVVKDWHSGDIQSRIHSDCNEVVSMVAYSGISFLLTLIRLLASFGFLWSMDPMLAFIILAITPLFLFSKVYFRRMRRLSKEVKQKESDFWRILQENLRFRIVIRAMDLLSGRREKLENSQDLIYKLKSEQLNFSSLTQLAMKFTINIGYLLTFIWGVYRLHAGEISFGTMTAFLQLVGRIQTPVLTLSGFFSLFIRFRTSLERIMELMSGEKEPVVAPQKIKGLTTLYIDNLTFKYEDQKVIDGLNMKVKIGEPTAIIGSSGKGKTTLMRLLLALLQPDNGWIWLADCRQKYVLNAGHRVNFAYVPQGNTLFSGSIRENLLIATPEASQEKLKYALWLSCAEFVYHLPHGIDTIVGESGHGLSEGQAQRIAIARAMMRDCDIWLFDEITSALDKETASRLTERLIKAGENKLCIFVTHDFNLAENCNQTIYIN
ncbi:ABC transporter ATP-binding protein [Pedobacter antarcticus]|uniref:ABC transporter ATP-binding protein n=1 Tax=Pedobacter antarcticus TaxID=34086 RepID=UPI00292F7F9E|nr:ABC transporter ATP-binding protein [Pedobacter antarcticus]